MRGLRVWLSGDSALLRGVARSDIGLCSFLTFFAVMGSTAGDGSAGIRAVGLLAALTAAAFTIPLLLRRRAPLPAVAAFASGACFNAILADGTVRCGAAIPVALMLLFSAGTLLGRGAALMALAIGLAGIAVEDVTDPRLGAQTLIMLLPLCFAAWLAGRVAHSRTAAARELEARTQLLGLQREQTAQVAVEVERLRIAADLDAVARTRVDEIVEIARSGEASLARGSRGTEATFIGIERRSRETLNQIRGLLNVLRSDDQVTTRQPQPSLDELDRLIENARHDGRVVRVCVEGHRRALPASVELSAYRILQETLEAMERGFEVSVQLGYGDDALELEVLGRCAATAEQDASVIALRERALIHGGTLAFTNAGAGRRAFQARLPLVAGSASA